MKSLQELIEPDGICFGCGHKNPEGLQLKSFIASDGVHVVAQVLPDTKFCGWPGLVYGGFLAMVIDCHSNYTAMWAHYSAEGRDIGSCPKIRCVTGSLGVKYIKPTPLGETLELRARVEGPVGRKTRVLCEVYAGALLTALGDSIFVRADPSLLAETVNRRG